MNDRLLSSTPMRRDLYEYMFDFLTEERKERFTTIASERTRHVTVVLEDLFQSHNASAVLRSCDCFDSGRRNNLFGKNGCKKRVCGGTSGNRHSCNRYPFERTPALRF